ncbi:MAG TPA: glycosyltransferase family 2 protein [Gemmatimonadales bacterium]|nr:glycosyltransferase family 2 protein [Gemmatimonadales bacterium]
MIYVCIPSHNEAQTVGLLLWKIRQVFTDFPREYQFLVGDDASTDATREVLEPYAKVLPLEVIRNRERQGTARTVEGLLKLALERTDRPKRDAAVVLHADFTHAVTVLPELIKKLDSGADLVVAEGTVSGAEPRGYRWFRRWGSHLLPRAARIPGVRDGLSGFLAVRLACLRGALRASGDRLLHLDGWAGRAELLARLGRQSRRTDVVSAPERLDLRERASRIDPWDEAKALWRARGALKDLPPALRAGDRTDDAA